MYFLNFNGKETNIHHFQGRDRHLQEAMESEYEYIKNNKYPISLPVDLTIITFATNEDESLLIKQLKDNNIPYINAAKEFEGEWKMPKKINMAIRALENVTTKYTLILDGYDVLVVSLMDVINKFKNAKTNILYNATKNCYPSVIIDQLPFREYIGNFNYLNAGCCIGYTDKMKFFYEECQKFIESPNYRNDFNSEQYVVRNIFKKYSSTMLLDYSPVKFDYNCNIFQCLGNCDCYHIKDDPEMMVAL